MQASTLLAVLGSSKCRRRAAAAVTHDPHWQVHRFNVLQSKRDFVSLEVVVVLAPRLLVDTGLQEWWAMAVVGEIHPVDGPTEARPAFGHAFPISPFSEPLVAMNHQRHPFLRHVGQGVTRPVQASMGTFPMPLRRHASMRSHPRPWAGMGPVESRGFKRI